jgi:cytochrome c-type biogenesis protein CcmF
VSELGQLATVLGAVCCAYAAGAQAWAARTQDPRWRESGFRALVACAACLGLACAVLVYALLQHDFRIEYVARNASLATPWWYRVSALWGAQAGSLLFWSWLLATVGAAAVAGQRRAHPELCTVASAVLALLVGFFVVLVAAVERPFRVLAFAPADGRGLNPLLEDPGMVVHPPLLYLGFVGLAVPYAFAMAALVTRKVDGGWLGATRGWATGSWLALGAGLVVGGWWAYRTLGWGGYWGWDPVENAALVPWLLATAYLHSAVVQERRGAFVTWNLALVVLSFVAAMLGTFLTRTGLVVSVHTFAQSEIGPYFLAFVVAVLAGSLGLLAWRWDDLRTGPASVSVASREGAFLFNNVLFVGFAAAVLVGTLYPTVVQALEGVQLFVGPPYYLAVSAPLGLALLVLMGLATALPWGRASHATILRLRLPLFAALAAAVAAGVLLRRPGVVAAAAAVAFALASTLQAFAEAAASGARAGRGLLGGLRDAFRWRRRRYAGYLVHLGVLVMVVGIVGSHAYVREREVALRPGERFTVGPYEVTYRGLEHGGTPLAEVTRAVLELREGGGSAVLRPVRLYYPRRDQVVSRPAIRSTLRDDVYAVLSAFEGDRATVRVWVNPLVRWVWAGGLVAFFGGLLLLWPDRRAPKLPSPPLRPSRDGHPARRAQAAREVVRALGGSTREGSRP